jgi:hypothetical protein
MLETRKFVIQGIPYFVALRLFLADRLAFTLCVLRIELADYPVHRINNSIRAYNPHPRWRMTLTSIIEVVVILAVIIAAIRFFVKRA